MRLEFLVDVLFSLGSTISMAMIAGAAVVDEAVDGDLSSLAAFLAAEAYANAIAT